MALGASLVLLTALAWGWMRSLFPQLRALEGTLSDVMGRAIGLMLVAALALLSISIIGYRNVCARFLLLRPFGDRNMTMPLRSLITQKVGHFGVVYTLWDQNYKPNIAASYLRRKWRPLGHIFAVLVRDSIRVIEVSSERDFLKLGRRLMRKIRPSSATVRTGGQALNIQDVGRMVAALHSLADAHL